MKFEELQLKREILKGLMDLKYEEATPIQEKTIPLLLQGKDVLGCAKTGSGKTAAFALPMLEKLSENRSEFVRGLIMTPTRELAMQIHSNIEKFAKYMNVSVMSIYGGTDQEEQVKQLEDGIDIIVATPGRLLDLMRQGYVNLSKVEFLVLDEADRMLDMGFINDILDIVKACPVDSQKLMFSATMPKATIRLADVIFKEFETIIQDDVNNTVDTVQQYVYYIDEENKLALLTSLLKQEEVKKAIVFTNTRQTAEFVTKHLLKVGVRSRAIHSEKSQNSRQDAILQFKNNRIKALVATDVAARGIDITDLKYVYNYDIPEREDSYIHRIGRTGRANEEGIAINFCSIDQMDDFKRIEAHTKQVIPQLKSEWPMRIFQKKAKKQKVKEEPQRVQSDDIIDITKVKDVSISGKPVKKRSNYQQYQNRYATAKEREGNRGEGKGNRSKSNGSGKNRKLNTIWKNKKMK